MNQSLLGLGRKPTNNNKDLTRQLPLRRGSHDLALAHLPTRSEMKLLTLATPTFRNHWTIRLNLSMVLQEGRGVLDT